MAANEAFILALALRGVPAKQIAAAFMVTDVAIYGRLENAGFDLGGHRRKKVESKTPEKRRVVVEKDCYNSHGQPAPAQG